LIIIIFYNRYSALGPVWANRMAPARCILGKFLGVVLTLLSPAFRRSNFRHQVPPRPPRSQWRKVELWARILSSNFAEMTTSTPFRDLLHAANLRHGTDGFASLPKEGVLKIFSPLKIRRLRPGLNLGTKGQHATPRPPKPINFDYKKLILNCDYDRTYNSR
jgi:hypothetical protein